MSEYKEFQKSSDKILICYAKLKIKKALNLKKEAGVAHPSPVSPSYHCFPYAVKLFHGNKMAEAFTKRFMKCLNIFCPVGLKRMNFKNCTLWEYAILMKQLSSAKDLSPSWERGILRVIHILPKPLFPAK